VDVIKNMPRALWAGLEWLRQNGRESAVIDIPGKQRRGVIEYMAWAEGHRLLEITRGQHSASVFLTSKGCEWSWWWSILQ
jgi:hypothetical protein